MEQVPKYAIIGNGKMATHMRHYFNYLKVPHTYWHRKIPQIDLQQAIKTASHVLVLIKDDAIVPFIEAHRTLLEDKCCIHCSGALSTPLAHSAHPLMIAGPHLYSFDMYKKIPFITEEGRPPLRQLISELPNPTYAIQQNDKSLYHALAVLSGNLPTFIWQQTAHVFEKTLHLPTQVLSTYLEQAALNFTHNPKNALTGPLARGDKDTIHLHQQVLADYPTLNLFYQALEKAYNHEHS